MKCFSDPTSRCHVNPAFQHNNETIMDDNGNTKFENTTAQYAIAVRHAQIQYKDVLGALVSGSAPATNVVLKDFNMTVKKGHIYGLLGASGCGKTSILRAIVGQIELTGGEIRVLGHKPKTPQSGIPGSMVGYMPQELSLMEEFTIYELLSFYGKIAGMRSEEIHDRCHYLVKLLDLPKPNRIIDTLSGGQRRRVSFAIALMHSPPVLILDEPTVGVDPLLRESIWEYLTKVARTNQTTVLITTHYIEEARQADTVGLMRHGKLMAEQSPQTLMSSLKCSNLEDVLVKLCILQSTKGQPILSVTDELEIPALQTVAEEAVENSEKTTFVVKEVSPIERVQVLAWKNAISLLRHYWFFVLLLSFPTSCVIIFCLSFGKLALDLKISVFNQETNCFAGGLIQMNPYAFGNNTNCEMPNFLSCKILESLKDRRILPVSSESESAARNAVRTGQAWGAMTFSRNFTSALLERARYVSPDEAKDEIIDMGTVQVTMDQSDQVVSNFVQSEILLSLKRVLGDMNAICHNFRHMKDLPIQYKTPVYGGSETSFIDTALPGVICGLSLMVPLTAALSTLLPEKISGTLERGLVAGVRMGEVIMSHFVICFVSSCVAIILLVVIPYVFFGLVMNGSFWTIAVVLFPLGVCGILLGFVLALLCDSVTGASILGIGFYFPCFFFSGALWPVEGIYPYIRPFCWVFPMTLSTEAIRFTAVRGWALNNKPAQLALTSTILWSSTFFILLLIMLRLKR